MLFYKKRLKKVISLFNPDICISSHFFTSIILSDFNKKGIINSKIITIITDYKSHKLWVRNQKNEDALIVGNEVIKNDLIASGLDKNKIHAFGIPLSEKFSSEVVDDKLSIIKKYGMDEKRKTILFLGGGTHGSIFSYDYLKKIVKDELDFQIIFVADKSEKLKEKCENLARKYNRDDIKVLGFSTDINNLLYISDLVITKPGGLAITECMEMKTPMLLIPGNGGQENDNARFLCFKGYAIKCRTPRKLSKVLTKITKNKNILLKMNSNLSRKTKNNSVKKIAKLVDKMLKKG